MFLENNKKHFFASNLLDINRAFGEKKRERYREKDREREGGGMRNYVAKTKQKQKNIDKYL